jgi:hypothetical protein
VPNPCGNVRERGGMTKPTLLPAGTFDGTKPLPDTPVPMPFHVEPRGGSSPLIRTAEMGSSNA